MSTSENSDARWRLREASNRRAAQVRVIRDSVPFADAVQSIVGRSILAHGDGIPDEEIARRACLSNWVRVARKMGSRYEACRIEDFELYGSDAERERQADAVASVREFVAGVRVHSDAGSGLVLFGPPGTGKDHLMAAAIREACRAGLTVEWVNGLDFFGNMRDRMDGDATEESLIRELSAPDILAISDPLPPWGPLTPFQAQTLFRLIDRRYRHQRPIWVTVNVASGKEASDRIGSAAIDRLKDRATTIHCNWPSHRAPA